MNDYQISAAFNGSQPSFFKPNQLQAVLTAHAFGIGQKLWTDYTMVFGDTFTCFSSVEKGSILRSITVWDDKNQNEGHLFSVEENGQNLLQTDVLKEALDAFKNSNPAVLKRSSFVLNVVR